MELFLNKMSSNRGHTPQSKLKRAESSTSDERAYLCTLYLQRRIPSDRKEMCGEFYFVSFMVPLKSAFDLGKNLT